MQFVPKLKINPALTLYLKDVPDKLQAQFHLLNVSIMFPGKCLVQQLIIFACDRKSLEKGMSEWFPGLADDALLWIAYPKKSGSIQSDLIRDEGWELMYQSEWTGVASISINEDWSAIRFRHKRMMKHMKRRVPMQERQTEGIDYVKRTVVLPEDALNALKTHPGLSTFFYTMSFTHQKEYAEAIADAKKPETRQRRIEKMIEMVLKLKAQKEAKANKK